MVYYTSASGVDADASYVTLPLRGIIRWLFDCSFSMISVLTIIARLGRRSYVPLNSL